METGIYKIVNKVNGKIYIGQSINIRKRFSRHKTYLNNGYHNNVHLQASWNKYGKDNFEFVILENCTECDLTNREQYWINYYNSIDNRYGYNKKEAGLRGRVTEETKRKLSEAHKGKIVSEETRLRRSKALKGKYIGEDNRLYGKPKSESQRQNMSDAKFGVKKMGASSQYIGVYWDGKRWVSQIKYNNKIHTLGSFKDEISAAKARDKKSIEIHGDKAKLNFPLELEKEKAAK